MIKSTPLVSVIIVSRNTNDYLEKCLNSVFNQTLKDIEVIVLKTNFSQQSKAILHKYEEHYTNIKTYIYDETNANSLWNYGVQLAEGNYIHVINDTDYCKETLLEKAVSLAQQTKSDIVSFDYIYHLESSDPKYISGISKNIVQDIEDIFNYRKYPNRILSLLRPTLLNKLIHTSVLPELKKDQFNFVDEMSISALCVANAQRIAYLNEAMITRQINELDLFLYSETNDIDKLIFSIEQIYYEAKKFLHYNEIEPAIQFYTAHELRNKLETIKSNEDSQKYNDAVQNDMLPIE